MPKHKRKSNSAPGAAGTVERNNDQEPYGEYLDLDGDRFYCIQNYDRMAPFFISLVSGSDHWLFVSSCGALTAGRVNSDSAIFPYYTEDKLVDTADSAGNVCILFVERGGRTSRWEPLARNRDDRFHTRRRIYKNELGSRLVFEEENLDLGLIYRYGWQFSDRYGLVCNACLLNNAGSPVKINMLNGLLNILPYGVTAQSQLSLSNLLDAYKCTELPAENGPAIYALAAGLSDQPAACESLKATTAWQTGLENPVVLLSSRQLEIFRSGGQIEGEQKSCGERGAFLLNTKLRLKAGGQKAWFIAVDVNRDNADAVLLMKQLKSGKGMADELARDIAATDALLRNRIAQGDGLQACAEEKMAHHHMANVMFNVMRGGVPAEGYSLYAEDWRRFVRKNNAPLADRHAEVLEKLPDTLTAAELRCEIDKAGCADLSRLARMYLPLTFSRRHGDPSRPWNRFSIRLRNSDGSPQLAYEGNWRDIFQNWEALGLSFPLYVENFITIFLCAITADGYNPGRISSEGIDWQVPSPGNMFSGYGYWSDHQIIYLLRLLEIEERFYPGRLQELMNSVLFSCANVPYRLNPYSDLLKDPCHSIQFDAEAQALVNERVSSIGSDGRLVLGPDGQVQNVTMMEKLLVLLLAKLGNFVPGGGIWMNTQRPEWNDANNALAGNGLSMVTTCYLYRYIRFLQGLMENTETTAQITESTAEWLDVTLAVLEQFKSLASCGTISEETRRKFMDAMGGCSSANRTKLYAQGQSAAQRAVKPEKIRNLLARALAHVERCIRLNQRPDGLYHSYNILHLAARSAAVMPLSEMLEGQVAVLASGLLNPAESLALLKALRRSAMYRKDQRSYMLYPRRMPAGFLERNNVSADAVMRIPLLKAMHDTADARLVVQDVKGVFHFNGRLRNSADVQAVIKELETDPRYKALLEAGAEQVMALFETTFHHREYTGRSGSMFGYEGVGCVYWHMVSKLLLAAQECALEAMDRQAPEAAELRSCYEDIRTGLGFSKTPGEFGAFPADPYSHTTWYSGARQPGMTGQVKEHIIARFGELGVRISAGRVVLSPDRVPLREFRKAPGAFDYIAVDGSSRRLDLPAGALAFTFCQTPFIYRAGGERKTVIAMNSGKSRTIKGCELDAEVSSSLFERRGEIASIEVNFIAEPL